VSGPATQHHSHSLVADFQHHTELPTTRASRLLDGFLDRVGRVFSFLWLAVIGVILVSVISRYVFSEGSVTMEEIQWHISSVAWLVGLSYAFVHDSHVRVDVIHERLSLRKQVWIELLGLLVLALPFLVIGVYMSWPYFYESFLQGEVSQAPAGLPYRWAMKFFMPLAFALLAIAGISRLLKCTALLFGWPQPLRVPTDDELGAADAGT
jgi:TRAP-type mannitol/chloroaromatic compound transport system permease small subunit